MVERVPTGIPGLDSLIQGGFPKGRTILVAGPTGAGKSILGMQFLYKGIMEYGEPGVFFTLDEPANQLREDMAVFGWDLEDLENSGKLVLLEGTAARAGFTTEEKYAVMNMGLSVDYLLHDIRKACSTIGAKRFVLDSI
ncbi:MAG: ATPase domain-containing protein, partial [archaeon]